MTLVKRWHIQWCTVAHWYAICSILEIMVGPWFKSWQGRVFIYKFEWKLTQRSDIWLINTTSCKIVNNWWWYHSNAELWTVWLTLILNIVWKKNNNNWWWCILFFFFFFLRWTILGGFYFFYDHLRSVFQNFQWY